jgi:hypothetical protein
MFKRCQRQYYFAHIAAHHSAKSDNIRREAYRLKQVKSLSAWKGSLIHEGINQFVLPCLQKKEQINWKEVINKTIELAKKQFEFSKTQRLQKSAQVKGGQCILLEHERGEEIPQVELDKVYTEISICFDNLASHKDIISYIQGRDLYYSERVFSHNYDGAQVYIVPDLIFSRSYGYPTIIDWKVEQDYAHGQHKLQVALYAWVLWNKWDIKKPEDVELYEVQLLEGNVIEHGCNSGILVKLHDLMFQSIYEIRSLCGDHKYQDQNLEDYEFAKSPNTCLYCSFQRLCREVEQWKSTQLIFLK